MNPKTLLLLAVITAWLAGGTGARAATINFSGYVWNVRGPGAGGPGPNHWSPGNVWVDAIGCLHVALTQTNGIWYCAELYSTNRFGFGQFQFELAGRVDTLDPNVVFGCFSYPTPDVGPDGTHEIDIEFSRWGKAARPILNYTIWPTALGLTRVTRANNFIMDGNCTTHRYTWSSTGISFQSHAGLSSDNSSPFATWNYAPPDPEHRISQSPMTIALNLWCYYGHPPTDGRPVELVVKSFKYTPL
jgi:hypothetical protein